MTGPKGGRPKSLIPHCKVTTWIPVELKVEMQIATKRDNVSLSGLTEEAIRRELKLRRLRYGNKNKKSASKAG